jgi:hypothetical protein
LISRSINIVVAGARTFDDYYLLSAWLDAHRVFYQDIVIVSGATPDADSLAESHANINWIISRSS